MYVMWTAGKQWAVQILWVLGISAFDSKFVYFQITGVHFLLYDEEEIQKLSVKAITDSKCFNNNQPVAGGLYDDALGPIEQHKK